MKKKLIPFALLSAAFLLGSCGGNGSSSSSSAPSPSSSESSASSSSVSSESSSESSSVAATSEVLSFDNLSKNFILTEGLTVGTEYEVGEEVSFDLTAGEYIYSGFEETHLEHIFVYVGDEGLHPTSFTAEKVTVTFTVPEEDFDVVVCYSVQQHIKEDGHSVYLSEDSVGTLYGTIEGENYDYIDCYVKFDTMFEITDFQYKMGDADWVSVSSWDSDCSFARVEGRYDLYQITIRPNYEDITADVVVKIAGVEKSTHAITFAYAGEYEKGLNLEESSLPTSSISGEYVYGTVAVNEGYYIASAEAGDGTYVSVYADGGFSFMMPDADITITFTFGEKIALAATAGDHLTSAKFYDNADTFYGVEITSAIPGDTVYLFVTAEEGYKPTSFVYNEETVSFVSYDNAYTFYAEIEIPSDATSVSLTPSASVAYTAISADSAVEIMFNGGHVYFEGETVSFSIGVPSGKKIESVSIVDENGTDLNLAVTLDATYGSFTMPAANVKVAVTFTEVSGDTAHVSATWDSDVYDVHSSTDYDWDFEEGFDVTIGSTFYLTVYTYESATYFVGIKNGSTVNTYEADYDEEMGEYTFGRSIVVEGDVQIKVGPTEEDVAFEAATTAHVSATFDEDQYMISSSTDYDWDFAAGFDVEIGSTFNFTAYDTYGMEFYIGVKIGDVASTYPCVTDEDTGETFFYMNVTATGDVTIKLGETESSVAF